MSQTKITDAVRTVTVVDGAKITTGTIPEARITSLDATKLTGNIASARIPASAVTQHVTGYNDASIRADILKLALSQAVDGNRVAFNLEDSFIDGFEDDTGITTETTVDRDTSGEYINSAVITESAGTPAYVTGDRRSAITLTWAGFTFAGGTPNGMLDGVSASPGISAWVAASPTVTPSAGAYIRYQFSDNNSTGSTKKLITEVKWYQNRSESHGSWRWQGSNDASSWTNIGNAFTLGGATTQTQTELSGNTTQYTYYQMLWQSGDMDGRPYMQEIEFKQADVTTSTTINATGTLISDPQTASTSRTSASGVIIYEDGAGTNTLGTDLKIYFSCNNSAWIEASSYGTATTYSGTKKLVKLGATTCTAGTAIAMKAVWANQSASKEARLHGWAVNY